MFIGILFILTLCWITFGRNIYINIAHGKVKSIEINQDIDAESLVDFLKTEEVYPDAEEIFCNDKGDVIVKCRYAQHTVKCKDKQISVTKDWGEFKTPKSIGDLLALMFLIKYETDTFKAKCNEEADCLLLHIMKAVNPDAPINPPLKWLLMYIHYSIRKVLIALLCTFLICCILTVAYKFAIETGLIKDSSYGIKDSYLSGYSTTETIGEAFEDFFTNPEWKHYEIGAQEMVDFKGNCTYFDEPATMIITFIIEEDHFWVSEIKVDGNETSSLLHSTILETIYSE